jgi:hypothetical protein
MLSDLLASPYIPFLTFLLGLLLGHRFALFRDKRKELNELVGPVRRELSAEAERPSPMRAGIRGDDVDAIAARLHWINRRRFLKACESYWQAKQQTEKDALGQPFHDDPESIRQAVQVLLVLLALLRYR